METFDRLNMILKLFNQVNTFIIQSIDGDNKYKITTFKPVPYKKVKDFITYPTEMFENLKTKECGKTTLMDSSRMVLTLIRDNHDDYIEDIFFKYHELRRQIITIVWKENPDFFEIGRIGENSETDIPNVNYHNLVKKNMRFRKENNIWDSDFNIWPKFIRMPDQKYLAKDVIDAIRQDNVEFIRKVIDEKKYLEFLLSKNWNPKILLGNSSVFNSFPRDDFGEYDPNNNACIYCAEFNALKCLGYLLANGAYTDYQNKCSNTALHVAVYYDHDYIVRDLLMCHANTTKINIFGLTPLRLAKQINATKSLFFLEK